MYLHKTPAARCPPLIMATAAGRSLTFPLTVPPALPYCAPVPSILRPFSYPHCRPTSFPSFSHLYPSHSFFTCFFLISPRACLSLLQGPRPHSLSLLRSLPFQLSTVLTNSNPLFKHTRPHCPSVHLRSNSIFSCLDQRIEAFCRHARENTQTPTQHCSRAIHSLEPSYRRGLSMDIMEPVSSDPTDFSPESTPSPMDAQSTPPQTSSSSTSAPTSSARRPPRKSTLTQQQKNQKRQRATQDQLVTLEAEFAKNPTPTAATRERIASEINMTERSVQIWFQNRYVP